MNEGGPENKYPSPEAILRGRGLRPKRAWGQSFLRDPAVAGRIASLLDATADDRVVELGAGLGHLTFRIAESGAKVTAVERDRDLVPVLEDIFAERPEVTVLAADAKGLDFAELRAGGPKLLVAGNLPYHLTTPILLNVLEQRAEVKRAVFMVQKEVADRLAAEPGGKDYGILSVQAQMWASVRQAFDVSPGSFFPPPSVVSSVLRLDLRDEPLADPGDPELFRKLVRLAFSQRRKTLRNSLKSGAMVPAHLVDDLFERAGLDPVARAETISVEGFARLARAAAAIMDDVAPPR